MVSQTMTAEYKQGQVILHLAVQVQGEITRLNRKLAERSSTNMTFERGGITVGNYATQLLTFQGLSGLLPVHQQCMALPVARYISETCQMPRTRFADASAAGGWYLHQLD